MCFRREGDFLFSADTVESAPEFYARVKHLDYIFLLAAIVALLGVGTRLADLIIATPWVQPRGLDAQLIRLSCRVLSVVGAGIILLEGGRRMGIPTVTLATSAGVGGLALALSAQDILKNVLGGMMLTLDKPFRSGERILVSGYDGVVEQVGLRSTRIRLGDGHQVSIPNEVLAHSDISNLSRREHFQRSATIELPSDTPSAKIRRALEILRKILENHEGMPEDFPPRVYLRDLKESSIAIFMIYRYQSADYWEFLAFSENVNLAMAEQFEAENIPFAAPALDVHLAPLENPQGATT